MPYMFVDSISIMKQANRGRFVVYEGIDGSGTTTQVALLAGYLRKRGFNVYETAEPTRGPFGSVIRQALEGRLAIDEHALAAAFAADRYDHLYNSDRGILWQLGTGTWVICDRYVLSSVVYQAASGLPTDWIHQINRFVVPPDLTIFIDTPVVECLARIGSRSTSADRYEHDLLLSSAVIRYQDAIKGSDLAGRTVVVNGSGTANQVFAETLQLIERSLDLTSTRNDGPDLESHAKAQGE